MPKRMPSKKTVKTEEYVDFNFMINIVDEEAVPNDKFTRPNYNIFIKEPTKNLEPTQIESESEENFVYKMNF